MEVKRELVPTTEAVSEARLCLEELRYRLSAEALEDARIVLNELVTNSVRHARLSPGDRISLRLTLSSNVLRAEVRDPGPPFEASTGKFGLYRTSGWGLYLVEQLSERWGVERDDLKCVWFELGPNRRVEAEERARYGRIVAPTPFSARVREERGVLVVETRGDVDLTTFAMLQAAIEKAVARAGDHAGGIVLDLNEVGFFDSIGIGVLVGSTKRLRERGGKVHLATREGPCLRVLKITGLDKVFEIHTNTDTAVEGARSHSERV